MKLVTVQESFEDVIEEVRTSGSNNSHESFWITERDLSSDDGKQDYYDIEVTENLIGSKDIKLTKLSRKIYQLEISLKKYTLKASEKCLSLVEGNITAVALSDGNILAVGTSNGEIYIYDLKKEILINKIINYEMVGITNLRIFASEEVIISVSEDITVRIWSITSKEPVREFRNHLKGITDIKLIGQIGRNFVTSSRDGSINLYECGSGKIVHKFQRIQNHNDPVNCIAIGHFDSTVNPSEFEFETEGKCIYAGYDSGVIQQYDLAGHTQTRLNFSEGSVGSVKSIENVSKYLLSGYENGLLRIWDITLKSVIFNITLNTNHPIEFIKIISYNELSKEIVFLVYNGPETLLQFEVNLRNSELIRVIYCIGLPELFQIASIDKNNEIIVAGGKYNLLALFNI